MDDVSPRLSAGIVACDFFTVDTVLLRHYYVLFFIELKSRRVHLAALIWNRRHLEQLLREYVEHYNTHRPHRSLGQRAPDGRDVVAYRAGRPIRRHPCGGLINEYRRAA